MSRWFQLKEDSELRDYTTDMRTLYISGMAALLGAVSSVLAWLLIRMIDLATNLFYYQRVSLVHREPSGSHMGWSMALMPVLGGLIVGLIAKLGSKNIRGHGMPEAIEAVVFQGGRVDPKIAILKPIATAISIGSGGPFGAEGPIIMTGGAVGSVMGQLLPMSDAERTTLLVAGAAAGIAATFSCPLAAILLSVEMLLFEWRPRSLVPVAIASVTAGILRHLLLGPGPVFPMQPTVGALSLGAEAAAVLVGIAGALLATVLGRCITFFEDVFEHLPVHWMWWPAIGGIVVGLGGLIMPQTLGAGYDVIGGLALSSFTLKMLLGILLVKCFIWTASLGSNTAGGILAPLLMIGGAMGGLMGLWLPGISPGAWAVIGMAAVLAGSLGAPLTAAMMATELTHNGGILAPLLLASVTAYALCTVLQPRSILTQGMSRRGRHLSREYSVDPLEIVSVREVMRTSIFAFPSTATVADARQWVEKNQRSGDGKDKDGAGSEKDKKTRTRRQRLFPVVGEDGHLLGVLTPLRLASAAREVDVTASLLPYAIPDPRCATPDMHLRSLAETMAASGVGAMPVVETETGKVAGLVTMADLLQARQRAHQRETDRSRVLRLRWPFSKDESKA